MLCTMLFRSIVVVELAEEDARILPKPQHVINYQSGTLRYEYPRDTVHLVALRLCGVEGVPYK